MQGPFDFFVSADVRNISGLHPRDNGSHTRQDQDNS
jgi:hypothetical protein